MDGRAVAYNSVGPQEGGGGEEAASEDCGWRRSGSLRSRRTVHALFENSLAEEDAPERCCLGDYIGKAEEQNSLRTNKRVRTAWAIQKFSVPGQARNVRLMEDGREQKDQGEDARRAEWVQERRVP